MAQPVVDSSDSDLNIRSRILSLEPGMYVFRYASDLPRGQEVCITLQQAPVGKGSLDFFPSDGVARNTLAKLGDCVVVRVRGDAGAVLVTEYHVAGGAPRVVNLLVDRIDTSRAIIRHDAAGATSPALTDDPSPTLATGTAAVPLVLSGHVERRGDVHAEAGWLGTPHGNARLEGFCIAWPDKPAGVDLAYGCRVRGLGRQPAALSGGFVGTRGRAAGIVAVTFGLVGPHQKRFRLAGQAVFSGCSPQDVVNGRELSGRTGEEHLVAIHVSVSPQAEALAPRYQSPWEDPAITRIYNAHG